MYRTYWQLERRPFDDFADASFYYPGEAHQGALLKLRYAVESGQPAMLLAGAPGVGKTLLVHALCSRLPERFSPRIHVTFTQMPPAELLAYIAAELAPAAAGGGGSIEHCVRTMEQSLRANAQSGRHAVVIVDEAQLLAETGALEMMRLLLNLKTPGSAALSLLLVGQPAILPALERVPSLEERMGVKCLMRPMNADETAGYVAHRLAAAGARRPIFDGAALDALHRLSHGIPRRINRLADLALLVGFAEELASIGAAQIEAVCEELVSVTPE